MVETFMINQLMIQLENMMKLERSRLEKEIVRKIATGKGDNYATGCLLDYDYFKKNYHLIAVDLSKQRELDADPRAIQQIEFIGMLKTRSNVFTILEKSKEAILEFYKETAKVM